MELRGFVVGVFFSFFLFLLFNSYFGGNCAISADAVFSPQSEGEIIELIRSANTNIDLEMYVFTNEKIARELGDASARGVSVRVIMEQRVDSYNQEEIVDALISSGVEVRWASFEYKLTHTKMMLVDGERVFVGSTNFSKSAMGENREMAVVLEGDIVSQFIFEFEKDWRMGGLVE